MNKRNLILEARDVLEDLRIRAISELQIEPSRNNLDAVKAGGATYSGDAILEWYVRAGNPDNGGACCWMRLRLLKSENLKDLDANDYSLADIYADYVERQRGSKEIETIIHGKFYETLHAVYFHFVRKARTLLNDELPIEQRITIRDQQQEFLDKVTDAYALLNKSTDNDVFSRSNTRWTQIGAMDDLVPNRHVHYEFIARANKFGVELHIEDAPEVSTALASTIRYLKGQVSNKMSVNALEKVKEDGNSRLKVLFDYDTDPQEVAKAMVEFIKITKPHLRSALA